MRRIGMKVAAGAVAALAVIAAAPVPAAADVPLALVVGITGPLASVGDQARRGAEAAVAAINAKGGVLGGQKLKLEIGDDACDPKEAVSVANQMVSKKIDLIIGHLCSGASIAASDVYNEEGALMITGSATNPTLTERGLKTVFRACGRDDQQGAVAGKMLAEKYRGKNIALVHDKSAYGKGLVDQAAATLKASGAKAAFEGSVNAGEKDFSSLITRLKQEKIDVVYYGGYHPEFGLMIRQSREQGFGAQYIGAEAMATNEFWAITGDTGAGTLFTYAPEVKTRPAAADALKAIRAGGAEPDNFAFYYYATVQVLAKAIDDAKSAKPDAVAKALRAGSFDTVVGSMAFDEKGDLKAPEYVFYEWRDGKYEPAKL